MSRTPALRRGSGHVTHADLAAAMPEKRRRLDPEAISRARKTVSHLAGRAGASDDELRDVLDMLGLTADSGTAPG